MHLPIGRLDREPLAVGLAHPRERRRPQSPRGVDEALTAMPLPLAPIVAALDTDRHRRRTLPRVAEGVRTPAALLPRQEDLGPTGPTRIGELASSADDRHQERV